MTRSVQVWRSVIVPMAVGAMTLIGPSMPSAVQADDEMKVEVTITDRGFDVKGHTTPGALTRIIVKNQGTVTHGITSPMFKVPIRCMAVISSISHFILASVSISEKISSAIVSYAS